MDPNVTLARLRDLSADVASGAASLNDVEELAATFVDLDQWFVHAGFFPDAWTWEATGLVTVTPA